MLLALAPRAAPDGASSEPPAELAPWEEVQIPRGRGAGTLSGTWFPAREPRGGVLLVHPWVPWGRAYFHRRGRIETLRAAGFHALAFDLPGFGGSGPPAGFFDRDVADALTFLAERAAGLPLAVWGISAGGYWAHMVLSARPGVTAAVFEDVSPHLIEWAWRLAPWGRPFYLLYRWLLPRAYRFLDVRRHAPALRVERTAYVSGADDRAIRPGETRALATASGGRCLVVDGAGHLDSIRLANAEVLELAMDTLLPQPSSLVS